MERNGLASSVPRTERQCGLMGSLVRLVARTSFDSCRGMGVAMVMEGIGAEPSVAWESVRIVAPRKLLSRLQNVHDAISARAREICEERGCLPGEDWEDWFRAEAEFLRPVDVHVSESEDAITVTAQVLGFCADELEITVEPYRIILAGKKQGGPEFTGTKTIYIDWSPDEILRIVPLPSEVLPTGAIAKTQAGLLEIDLPMVRRREEASDLEDEHSLFRSCD